MEVTAYRAGVGGSFGVTKLLSSWLWWWLHNSVTTLKITELIIQHVNYMSTKSFFKTITQ